MPSATSANYWTGAPRLPMRTLTLRVSSCARAFLCVRKTPLAKRPRLYHLCPLHIQRFRNPGAHGHPLLEVRILKALHVLGVGRLRVEPHSHNEVKVGGFYVPVLL